MVYQHIVVNLHANRLRASKRINLSHHLIDNLIKTILRYGFFRYNYWGRINSLKFFSSFFY